MKTTHPSQQQAHYPNTYTILFVSHIWDNSFHDLIFCYRLFDTNEDRYNKIKNEVSKMIMTQVGLTMFQYERDWDRYVATGYTFHLCPQDFGDLDQSFIFQASTLKFLCRHNFNFNKVISHTIYLCWYIFAQILNQTNTSHGYYHSTRQSR